MRDGSDFEGSVVHIWETAIFLHYKGYSAKADYSAEDRIFYGTILGISDMVEFQSENAKDLEDEFHQAVDEYLEFCKEIGERSPEGIMDKKAGELRHPAQLPRSFLR